MPLDCLTSPIPTGRYMRLDNTASEAAPNSSGCGRFTVATDVKKSQSFFPRVKSSLQNAMRRVCLIHPLPSTDAGIQSARAIYDQFRESEKAFRMMHIAKYPDVFNRPEFDNVNVSSLHKAFSRELDRRFSKFADILRATQAEHSTLDLPDALCKAYKRMVHDVLRNLSSNTVPYKEAMTEPMQELFKGLKGAITPSTNSSPSTPVLATAGEPPEAPLFEKDGIVCSEFAKMRMGIFRKEIETFKPQLCEAAQGMDNLRSCMGMLRFGYSNYFNEILSASSPTVSMEDLHEAHLDAAALAVSAASPHKNRPGNIPVSRVDRVAALLSAMGKYINAKVQEESKNLPNRRAPLAPLHPQTGQPAGEFSRMIVPLNSSRSGNGRETPSAPQASVGDHGDRS